MYEDYDDATNATALPTLSTEKANVTVIYENEDLEHIPSGTVTILDACGLVVYTIHPPWSSVEYPYVKGAILSTMFDQPCGSCDKVRTTN